MLIPTPQKELTKKVLLLYGKKLKLLKIKNGPKDIMIVILIKKVLAVE